MYKPEQLLTHLGNFLTPTNEIEYWMVRSYLAEKAFVDNAMQLEFPSKIHGENAVQSSIDLQNFIEANIY